MGVNGTLVEAKMFTFTLESMHFVFKKCPVYTPDGASAKFSTNSQETDYSEMSIKEPKLEIFGSGVFTQIRPVWVGEIDSWAP